MAFGVVLFTLLFQATTMQSVIRKLGVITRRPAQIEYEKRQAELTASRAAESHLERRYREGLISGHAWQTLRPRLQEQNARLAESVRAVLRAEPSLEEEELEAANREILRAKRSAYLGLRRDGVISEDVYAQLTTQIDAILEEERQAGADLPPVSEVEAEEKEERKLELRELVVEPGSSAEGRRVRHIPWPESFIIASLRRGEEHLVPGGETILQSGDVLLTVANLHAFEEARGLCAVKQN
jgi:NhaP-type Na+/H+ and K+/H+ antiporter